jgi:hypothetical protein
MGSTDTQITRWATKHHLSNFLGVFSADTLPHPCGVAKAAPCSLIFNYDPASMPGSHWVACLVLPDEVSFFDSYGLPPDAPDLIIGHVTHFGSWLRGVCSHLGLETFAWNTADLQGWTAKTCGEWSLYFCKNGVSHGWGVFSSDLNANDRRIQELVVLE